MISRFNWARKIARTSAAKPAAWGSTARALLSTAQHTLTGFGLSAIVILAILFARPDLAKQAAKFLLPTPATDSSVSTAQAPALPDANLPTASAAPAVALGEAQAAPLTAQELALQGSKKQQQFVTTWLSKRYRVAGDAANMLVSTAYVTAIDIKLDPLLILAVMAIESGLNPFAESPVGAQGLMQVMSKIHHDKFRPLGGVQAALNPVANIRVGALILKDYVTRGGSVEAGLKTYVGAAAFENDSGYGSRVMAEYSRLKQVAIGKKVPTSAPVMPVAAPVAAEAVPAVATAPLPVKATEAALNRTGKTEQIAGL